MSFQTFQSLYSPRLERHVLGGLIKNPSLVLDINSFLNENDFFEQVHQVIYSVLSRLVFNQKQIDKVILAQKIKELGINFKDDVNVFDYIESISFTQITDFGTIEAAKDLVKLRIKRDIFETAENIKVTVLNSKDLDTKELISKTDAIYNNKIRSFSTLDDPINVFEGIEDKLEQRAANPSEEIGFATPFPEFNRLFGGLRSGNVYAVCSRAGQGKTTWLNEMLFGVSRVSGFRIPVFIVDTEMFTEDIQTRMMSAISGVPMWFLETGQWKRNQDMYNKVKNAIKEIELKKYVFRHLHVRNLPIEQVESTIRRWYFTKVGEGKPAVIGYDYLKLTEKLDKNWAEYQAIGEKVDRLKRLSEELGVPIFTAMQLNRMGENQNRLSKNVVDDSSVFALSDRLQWFGTWVAIFRRKTLDEIEEDGEEFGTHKLIITKSRFQGRDAPGHQDILIRPTHDGKRRYVHNFINYQVDNFKVTEKGSLRDIIYKLNLKFDFDKNNPKGNEEVL